MVRVWSPVETRLTGGALDCRSPIIIVVVNVVKMVKMVMMTMGTMNIIKMVMKMVKITFPTLPLPPTSPWPGEPYLSKLSSDGFSNSDNQEMTKRMLMNGS